MARERERCTKINPDLTELTLTERLASLFDMLAHTWALKDGKQIIPTSNDMSLFMDEAVRNLHDEPVGTRLTSGRLIVEKLDTGYDIYVHVGEFK